MINSIDHVKDICKLLKQMGYKLWIGNNEVDVGIIFILDFGNGPIPILTSDEYAGAIDIVDNSIVFLNINPTNPIPFHRDKITVLNKEKHLLVRTASFQEVTALLKILADSSETIVRGLIRIYYADDGKVSHQIILNKTKKEENL